MDARKLCLQLLKAAQWEINSHFLQQWRSLTYQQLSLSLYEKAAPPYLNLDIVLVKKRIVFLQIHYGDYLKEILELITLHQDLIPSNIPLFLKHLIHAKLGQIYLCKYLKKETYLTELSPSNIPTSPSIKWLPIEEKDFDFYLGTPIETHLFISIQHQKLAHQRLINYIKEHPDEFIFSDKLSTSTNLADFFNQANFVDSVFDEQGNIIDVHQGGDMWIFWELSMIKDLINDGAYIVLQDDGAVFWKVVFYRDKVVYFREQLEQIG